MRAPGAPPPPPREIEHEGLSTPKPGLFWGPLPKSPARFEISKPSPHAGPSLHPPAPSNLAGLLGPGHRFCDRKTQFLSKPAVCAGPPSGLGLKMKTARHPHTGPPPQNQSPVRGPLVGLVPKRKASSKPEGGGGPHSKPRRRPGPYYPSHDCQCHQGLGALSVRERDVQLYVLGGFLFGSHRCEVT